MRTLQLTIKSKWFNLILSGEKKEEYREIKEYWVSRLVWLLNPEQFTDISDLTNRIKETPLVMETKSYLEYAFYSKVQFTNGYGKDKPTATFECLGIRIGKGEKKLGASDEDVFIIKLGKELSRNNIKN